MLDTILPYYEVSCESARGLLLGRALRALSAIEVTEACELLLATAEQHDCRFWLLDGRANDAPPPPGLHDWLLEDFMPRIQATLGKVPYLAFVVTPTHWAQLTSLGYIGPSSTPAMRMFQLAWFDEVAPALNWLSNCHVTRT